MKKPYAAAWAQIYAISGHEESVKEIGFTSIIRGKKGGVIRIHNGRQLWETYVSVLHIT